MADYSKISDNFGVYDFNSFIPSESNPMPYNRIMDFIVTGPFVLETDGSFEAEHMYRRDKLLYEDYLAADGGERNIVPELGKKVRNNYFGPEYRVWEKGFIKWNCLRFDREEDAVDPALYATEQRNAVYYTAFYLDCAKAETAVISHEDSGCALFVNGEQVDFQPFGRVKGLWDMGHQCLVKLKKGRNLVLFKLRPGYIADTMDISIASCVVFPVIASNNGVHITSPTVTYAYSGTAEKPEQIFPLFAAAEKDIDSAEISCFGSATELGAMKAGEVKTLRLPVPADGKNINTKLSLTAGGKTKKTDIYFSTSVYDGFEGHEHVFSDFHFDTTYHQEQRTYALGAFHITKSIVERLLDNPDFKATLSEIDYLHPYYTLYPEHRDALRGAFESGRAEADCFYNQPNDLTSSGEAFVRNLIYGQFYHRDVMGRISTVYAPGDVFGHFSQISQVCLKGGCNYIKWGKAMMGVDRLFRHVSSDGSTLLHDKGFGRTEAARLGVSACGASGEALSYIEPYPRDKDTSWMKKTVTDAHFSVFSELADEVIESCNEGSVDYTSRDLTQHHSGVLLTRTDFKQANRLCENLLVTAEKFATAAFLCGASYPELTLDKAWRQLLCAQHHDSVTGTNNEISFIDLMIEYRECAELASKVVTGAAKYLAARVGTENRENAVFVFNPCTWERSGECRFDLPKSFKGRHGVMTDTRGRKYPVEIKNGKGVFYPEKLPAMGYALFRLSAVKEENVRHISGKDTTIENRRFTLTVDPERGGTIVSLYDKIEKREVIDSTAGAGNMINVLKELHDRMETQHEIYTTGHKMVSADYAAEVVSDKCPLYQKLIVRVKLDVVATVIQEITLRKNSDTVDFRTVIEDYNSEDDLFSVTFPVNVNGGAVVFDDRFAPHVSTRSKKFMSFQTHQYASFSGCRVLPANQWFGVGPSVTVRLGRQAFNVGMTAIIRRPEYAESADKLLKCLTKKGVPVTPYPDTVQHGGFKIIHFNEDIYETDTRFVLCVKGDSNTYAEILRASTTAAMRQKADDRLEKSGVSVMYFRDSDNEYKKPVDTVLITAADRSALDSCIESIAADLLRDRFINVGRAVACDRPLPCDDYGAAILNSGNIACSVEGKSTLNLMLFHTASFYGNMGKVTGGRELVPEKKTHSVTYSLYPHSGSYREADVYGKAFEFNDGLFAVTDTKAAAETPLPERKSFLKTSEGFAVTAVKPGGFPLASMKRTDAGPGERGVIVRGFETDGISMREVQIKTGFDIARGESTDLLEENRCGIKCGKNSFCFVTDNHSIETFRLIPKGYITEEHPEKLTDDREICSPVYVRSWEHDMGSMPMGYLKFAATLNKKPVPVDDTHLIIELNAVNNSGDEKAEREVTVLCSDGISTSLSEVSVSLEAGESKVIPLAVTLDSPERKGQVRIYYTDAGQTFTDVYELGYFNPEITMELAENRLVCRVENPTDQHLEASLLIASPFETWGTLSGDNSIGDIGPLCADVSLAPFERKTYEFDIDMPDEGYFKAFWAAAKLCCNGRIHFAFAEKHGPRHNYWAHEFINEIAADNGSIKKLLQM